jgi:hypothetical protein
MLAKTAVFIALHQNVQKKGFVEESLVESDQTRYAFSAAFKAWSFGAFANRSRIRGLVQEVAC